MPSSRAVLRDIDSLGLNPAKAHSMIKASGRLGVKLAEVLEEEKHDKSTKHKHGEKSDVKKVELETKTVEKEETKDSVVTTTETKKVELKVEEKPVEKKSDSEKLDEKELSDDESKDKKQQQHNSRKKLAAHRSDLFEDLLFHLTDPHP